jgi:multidrug efflux system membrane fusion protein
MVVTACDKPAPRKERPTPVVAAKVTSKALPLELSAVGTVEPEQSAAIRAQVSGVLVGVGFNEGDHVKASQVLFRIDPRPFQIAVKQAEAVAERDRLTAEDAQSKAARYEGLAKKNYVPQDQYETLRTQAATSEAARAVNLAQLERAKLDLEFATIRAPFAGRSGEIHGKVGNLVRVTDQTPLVVIHQIDPILVRFAVPEAGLPRLQRYMAQGALKALALPDGATEPLEGELVFIDNAIDPQTATIAVKARFKNPTGQLWPGRSATVRLLLDSGADTVVVPSQAIQIGQKGPFVFVLGQDNTVTERPIEVGRNVDGLTAVTRGLSADEQVIVDGQLKLVSGAKVDAKTDAKGDGKPDAKAEAPQAHAEARP